MSPGSSRPRVNGPAEVRYYFDADVLGLAKVMSRVRVDVTFPGDQGAVLHKRERPPCPITATNTPDTVWIPQVASRRWLVITRDRNISAHRAEIQAVRDAGARMVALAAGDARTTFDQLELLMIHWRPVGRLLDREGPFIYSATRSSLREIDLSP